MKTYALREKEIVNAWHVVNATGVPLGRLASKVASILRGKHKPTFTPWMNNGDFVVVTNAGKIELTGSKLDRKFYYRHSGYPGGLRKRNVRETMNLRPERVIEHAVRGMLPRNVLGEAMFRRLKVYSSANHPHAAQQPIPLSMDDVGAKRGA